MELEVKTADIEKELSDFINQRLAKTIEEKMNRATLIIERRAKELCPVDSGDLKRSITHKVLPDSDGEVLGKVFTNKEYAPYVHEGTGIYAENGRKDGWTYKSADGSFKRTKGQKPQRFLSDAAEEKREEVLRAFGE